MTMIILHKQNHRTITSFERVKSLLELLVFLRNLNFGTTGRKNNSFSKNYFHKFLDIEKNIQAQNCNVS